LVWCIVFLIKKLNYMLIIDDFKFFSIRSFPIFTPAGMQPLELRVHFRIQSGVAVFVPSFRTIATTTTPGDGPGIWTMAKLPRS